MAAVPKFTATKAIWSKFIADTYPDVDQTGMTRNDLRDVHKLRNDGNASTALTEKPATKAAAKARNTPTSAEDYRPPSLADVPKELQFSTDTGEDREIERTPFAMDGIPFWLYRPSDSALTLYTNQLLSDDARQRTNAMVLLVQQALDASGLMYLQERITDKANNFDDGLYGNVVAAVLQQWGDETAAEKFKLAEKNEAANRKSRRAAARSK